MTKTAIFYDLENCLNPGLGLGEIFLKLQAELPERSFTIQRVYANFAQGYAAQVEAIQRYGMTPVQVFAAKANAVDFELSLDAVRLVLTNPGLSCVVIVSNDADFLPLFRHLRALQIEVVCALTNSQHHAMLPSNADRVIRLFQTPRPEKAKTAPKPASAAAAPSSGWPLFRKIKAEAPSSVFGDALESYLAQVEKYGKLKLRLKQEGLLLAELATAIKRANPEFTSAMYGFSSFAQLLLYFLDQTSWGVFRNSEQAGILRLCLHAEIPPGYAPYQPGFRQQPADLAEPTPLIAFESLND